MLFRFASSMANFWKSKPARPAPAKGVPELLAALAEARARMAELDREEKAVLVAIAAKLREQQEALEELKKKVHACGIEVEEGRPSASCASPSEAPLRPSALLNH